jgi:hypothetical protein
MLSDFEQLFAQTGYDHYKHTYSPDEVLLIDTVRENYIHHIKESYAAAETLAEQVTNILQRAIVEW